MGGLEEFIERVARDCANSSAWRLAELGDVGDVDRSMFVLEEVVVTVFVRGGAERIVLSS